VEVKVGKLPFEKIERKVLTKKSAKTDPKLGKNPEERSTEELIKSGIINLNKPPGPTSHQVADYIKKILNIKKAGHGGTLDPKVTGCLPIALEKATRIVQTLLPAGKEYVCLMYIHKRVEENKIKKAFEKFSGEIKQIPPIRSAVKRQERTRKIYYIEILEIKEQDVLFRIGCQAGTYIRKFVHDLGKDLGIGAHMHQLIRTKAGPFTDKEMYAMYDLKDAYEFYKEGNEKELRKILKPFETAVNHLGKIWVLDSTVDPLCHGADLYLVGISKLTTGIKENDLVAIFTLKNELICIGKAVLDSETIQRQEKGEAVKTTKVFMDRGIYSLKNID